MFAHAITLILYPLQFDPRGVAFKESNPKEVLFVGIAVVALVIILVVVNKFKKKLPVNAMDSIQTTGSGGGFHPFASIGFHSQLRSMGLNHDQIKMMDYVFKQDKVTNPQHSLNSAALLDRHFRKAYRIIERSARTDEEAQQRFSLLFSTRNILEAHSGETATSTRQIPENAAAVLGYGNDRYPVKIISTKGDHMVVENPQTPTGSNVQIPRGSKVTISFFTKSSKGFSFESRILGVGESGSGQVLQLLHSNKVNNLSKRRFRRRQVMIPVSFYFVNLEDTGKKEKRMVVDKRRLTGSIMDISIGGCSIKTNVLVPSGSRLKIEADGDGTIVVLGQVIRINRTGMKTTAHVSFLKVPRKSLNAINAMVFEYTDE
jgi:c-di-GMP-binding flagellar brake protein YcgR